MTDLTNAELARELIWMADHPTVCTVSVHVPQLREAARRLAAPENEDETVKAEPVLDHRGHLIGWRRTEQEPILSSYRKRPAQQKASEAMSEWRTIDSAPRGPIMLFIGVPVPGIWNGNGWNLLHPILNAKGYDTMNGRFKNEPTHWMPLPSAPNRTGDP